MIDQQDQDVYDEVGSAFAEVRLDREPADVIRRGRTLRRRRQAMPALAAAGVLAFSLSLAAVTQTHGSSNVTAVNVNEAAFSVHTDAETGIVTVTFREITNEKELIRVLAEAGIPAVFHTDGVSGAGAVIYNCKWTGATVLDMESVIAHEDTANGAVFKINRNAMPRGSVLAFSFVTRAGASQVTSSTLLSGNPTGCTYKY